MKEDRIVREEGSRIVREEGSKNRKRRREKG